MKHNFWNIFFIILFTILVVFSFGSLVASGRVFYDVPERDIVLMSLAIFRLTRLFTYDKITQFVRDWFTGAREGTLRATLDTLITCPWCTGLWFSFLVVVFYFSSIYSWPVILVLALAAIGSFVQILANWIGWSAEYKKMLVQEKRGEQ